MKVAHAASLKDQERITVQETIDSRIRIAYAAYWAVPLSEVILRGKTWAVHRSTKRLGTSRSG